MDTEYRFTADNRQYIFDGSSLSVYEVSGNGEQIAKPSVDKSGFDSNHRKYLRSIALNLTNNCNLVCSYCYANQGCYDNPGVVMSFDTARRSVEAVVNSVVKNGGDVVTVGFFGGEPLLEFDLIEKVVEFTNAVIPDGVFARYLITTNGTLLEPRQVALMAQNRFHCMLSIDGDEDQHNAYRLYPGGSGSYSDVVRAVELLLGNVSVEARITIADKNTAIDRAVAHILSLGIRRITYALDYQLSDKGFECFLDSLERLFVDYRVAIRSESYFDLSNATEPALSIVAKKKKRSHCNAGVSYMSVSVEGNFYHCPRFTGNKLFSVGTVQHTSEQEIAGGAERFLGSLLEDATSRTTSCATCVFAYLCGGICYHHALSISGNEFATVPRECKHRHRLYAHVLKLLCSLTVSERRGFLLHLSKFWKDEGR